MLKGSMYYIGPKIPTNVSFENPKSRQERYLLLFHLFFFFPSYQLILLLLPTPCHYPGHILRSTHKTNTLYHALANPNTPVFPFRPYPSSRFPLRPCRRPILAALASTISVQKATVTEDDPIMHTWAAQVIN